MRAIYHSCLQHKQVKQNGIKINIKNKYVPKIYDVCLNITHGFMPRLQNHLSMQPMIINHVSSNQTGKIIGQS